MDLRERIAKLTKLCEEDTTTRDDLGETPLVIGDTKTCVCPECGYELETTKGVPCMKIHCPECGAFMVRADDDGEEYEIETEGVKRGMEIYRIEEDGEEILVGFCDETGMVFEVDEDGEIVSLIAAYRDHLTEDTEEEGEVELVFPDDEEWEELVDGSGIEMVEATGHWDKKVRGGKIVKVYVCPDGFKAVTKNGKKTCVKMTAKELAKRKKAAKRAAKKRAGKMARILKKRKLSMKKAARLSMADYIRNMADYVRG